MLRLSHPFVLTYIVSPRKNHLVLGAQKNSHIETVLLSTHNMYLANLKTIGALQA